MSPSTPLKKTRKPVDQQQPTECRQAIWDEIRRQSGEFTARDLDVKLELSSIKDYLTGLANAGYLSASLVAFPGKSRVQYRLSNDTGHEAPRVRRDGTPVTMGQGRQQMWNTMRVLKQFRIEDLAFNASTEDHQVAISEAKTYCSTLCRAGYLIGRTGQIYQLINSMWTGPLPPQIQRTKQVYDPNLKRVIWNRIEGGAE